MGTAKGGSRLFGGLNLKDVASQVKERGEGSPLERSPAQPTLAAAELALKGRSMPSLERENIHAVDPRALPAVEVPQPHGRLVHARALPGPDRFDREGRAAGAGAGAAARG